MESRSSRMEHTTVGVMEHASVGGPLRNAETNIRNIPEGGSAWPNAAKDTDLDVIIIKDEEDESDVEFVATEDTEEESNSAVEIVKADEAQSLTNDNTNCKINPRIYKCNQCDATFTSTCSRLYHARYHLDIKPYQCLCCGEGFTTPFGLTVHTKLHQGINGPRSYSCKLCSQSFCHLSLFDKHLNENHAEICLLCDKRYFTYEDLLKHTGTHSKYSPICRGCGKTFPRYPQLSSHIKMCEVLHTCSMCSKQFPAESHLNKHRSVHWQHKCVPCARNFESSTKHVTHLRRVHKGLACLVCKRVFDTSYARAMHHLKNQENSMRDRCALCGLNFRTHCDLTEHLYPAGLKDVFFCDGCNEPFSYPCVLEIHRTEKCVKRRPLARTRRETRDDAAQDLQDEMCVFVYNDDKIIYKAHKVVAKDDGNNIRNPRQENSQGVVLEILKDDCNSQLNMPKCVNGSNVVLVKNCVHHSSISVRDVESETHQDLGLAMQNQPPGPVVSDDNSQCKASQKVDEHESIPKKKKIESTCPDEEPAHIKLQQEIHLELIGTCSSVNENGAGNEMSSKETLSQHSPKPHRKILPKPHQNHVTLQIEDDELLAFADSDSSKPYNPVNGLFNARNDRHKYITSFQKFIAEDWTILRDPPEATKRPQIIHQQIDRVQQIEIKEESLEDSEEFVSIGK